MIGFSRKRHMQNGEQNGGDTSLNPQKEGCFSMEVDAFAEGNQLMYQLFSEVIWSFMLPNGGTVTQAEPLMRWLLSRRSSSFSR